MRVMPDVELNLRTDALVDLANHADFHRLIAAVNATDAETLRAVAAALACRCAVWEATYDTEENP